MASLAEVAGQVGVSSGTASRALNRPELVSSAARIESDDPEEARAKLAEADFIVTGRITAEQIALAPRLKMIQMPGVGYEKIDVDAAEARGIPAEITPEGTVVGVSEHVVLMILALCKHLTEAHNALKEGGWIHNDLRHVALMLEGKRVGILGLGRIGREAAERVQETEEEQRARLPAGERRGDVYRNDRYAHVRPVVPEVGY